MTIQRTPLMLLLHRLTLQARQTRRKTRTKTKRRRPGVLGWLRSSRAMTYDLLVTLLTQTDSHGATPFHVACASGHRGLLTRLEEAGAAVGGRDEGGWTALHHASWRGHAQVVRWLLELDKAGRADVWARTRDGGQTALDMAQLRNDHGIVRLLTEGTGPRLL